MDDQSRISRDLLIRIVSETNGADRAEKAMTAVLASGQKNQKLYERLEGTMDSYHRTLLGIKFDQGEVLRQLDQYSPRLARATQSVFRFMDSLKSMRRGLLGVGMDLAERGYGMGKKVYDRGLNYNASLEMSTVRMASEIRQEKESFGKASKRAGEMVRWARQYAKSTHAPSWDAGRSIGMRCGQRVMFWVHAMSCPSASQMERRRKRVGVCVRWLEPQHSLELSTGSSTPTLFDHLVLAEFPQCVHQGETSKGLRMTTTVTVGRYNPANRNIIILL